jgi:NADH dehydrogenase [ubiquinone] 1 alpha subcomplex assembly factor 1
MQPLNPTCLRRRSFIIMRIASIQPSIVASFALVLCFSTSGQAAEEPDTVSAQSITEFDGKDSMQWVVVNDGVMGGLSEGKLTPVDGGTMKFSGMLSLENNGGFSTFRSGDVKLDLGSETGLLLRVKGDGRTYQARLATDALFRGMEVSFAADFATRKGEWIEVKVPFADFKGSFRGLDLPKERLEPSKVRRVSILLGDKKQAPFEIEIDFIRTYRAAPKS